MRCPVSPSSCLCRPRLHLPRFPGLGVGGRPNAPGRAGLRRRVGEPAAHKRTSRRGLRATIRRTKYGVPHIKARNWRSAGFGYAHAFAADNLCTIADSYVTVAGERSRYFGPDASWKFSGNGAVTNNLDSDFFYAQINDSGLIEDLMTRPPPEGPLPELKKVVSGYVAGYNDYLADVGVDRLPDKRCRGADWVRPITKLDVYRRFHQLGSLASAGVAITGIAEAAPAGPAAASRGGEGTARPGRRSAALRRGG